jgi:hypothetical protein
MIIIKETLVSEEILEEKFVCDLNACKGECCVAGESGAPLDEDEIAVLKRVYPKVKPYMDKAGIEAVKEQGVYVLDSDGDFTTPLIAGKQCAFVVFDENNIATCAIEKAHKDGKIDYKKPISCHLYPIRINKTKTYEALNYHRWGVCKPACTCGAKLNVPVYKFLKGPLVRKYGEEWYKELELVNESLANRARNTDSGATRKNPRPKRKSR